MGTILILAEQRQGKLHPQSVETVVAGQALAKQDGGDLIIALFGNDLGAAASELAKSSATRLLLVQHELLDPHNPDAICFAAQSLIDEFSPEFVLLPHTYQARDYAPRLAARNRRALISDCIGFENDGGQAVFVRQVLQGKANAKVVAAGAAPHFVSTQASAFQADALETGAGLQAETMQIDIDTAKVRVKTEQPVQGAEKTVDLSAAEVIVSVGRGIEAPENIEMAQQLAKAINGEVGASRPVCDAGWLPIERQVGSSGQTVTPKLYLALGISGSVQHMMGMKGSQAIVAINKDPAAPIFKAADYGVVGNVLEVVPAMLEALNPS